MPECVNAVEQGSANFFSVEAQIGTILDTVGHIAPVITSQLHAVETQD